jgi:hypothetical protein
MNRLEEKIQPMIAGVGLLQDAVHCKGIGAIIFRDIGLYFTDKREVVLVVDVG